MPKQKNSGYCDLKTISKGLEAKKYKNVVFFVGAGISTAAGIPDFRSPGTGLYDNLERLNLPYPEAVFDIEYFRKDPVPFFTLAKELYPGQFEPTMFHEFMRWVEDNGMLRRVYTQNIDTLERIVGIDPSKIVEAHGSFASNKCIKCGHVPEDEDFVKKLVLESKGVTVPKCPKCEGTVKPDITFFGEGLPERFFELMERDFEDGEIDLAIIAGTSLQVQPFAQLPDMVPDSCPRLLFNLDRVGGIGSRKNDLFIKGKLEDIDTHFEFLNTEDLAAELEELDLSRTSDPQLESIASIEVTDGTEPLDKTVGDAKRAPNAAVGKPKANPSNSKEHP